MRLIDGQALVKRMHERAEEEYMDFRDCRDMVKFAPTVEAIPIAFIRKQIEVLRGIADYEFEVNGCYVVTAESKIFILEKIIKDWAERKEE